MKNYYTILGVATTATAAEIRRRYRELARQYHPDTAEDKEHGEEKLKLVNEAYEVLSDPLSRRDYDLRALPRTTTAQDRHNNDGQEFDNRNEATESPTSGPSEIWNETFTQADSDSEEKGLALQPWLVALLLLVCMALLRACLSDVTDTTRNKQPHSTICERRGVASLDNQ